MDPLIPPKSPVLECILQDPDPPKKEDGPAHAEQGQITVDSSVQQESENGKTGERESESTPTPTIAPTLAAITTPSAPIPAPIATPVPAQVPTPAPTPVPAPVPIPGKMSRLQQVRQGIVHPQVGTTNFSSPICKLVCFLLWRDRLCNQPIISSLKNPINILFG